MSYKRIVIGGAVAAGKSSLAGALPFKNIPELDGNDELQTLLLSRMYQGDKVAQQFFQLDMLTHRSAKWMADINETIVFDRMIFEDIYFAKKVLSEYKNVWEFYQDIWEIQVAEMKKANKLPDFYILLDCNYENFEKRIFARNRKVEVENFDKNKNYFKEMINEYIPFVTDILKKHNIEYTIIDTNTKETLEVIDEAKKILKEKGIINE